MAAHNGHVAVSNVLIAADAELEARNDGGRTPLAVAAHEGHAEAVAALLARGADPNTVSDFGNTPLMGAILQKRTKCVAALLEATDLSVMGDDGANAFHSCVTTANEECFQLLLPRVSDVDVRTVRVPGRDEATFNETALHLACQKGQHRMAKSLLQRGASRMARDSMQCTPLHHAAQFGQLSCLVHLIGKPGGYKLTPAEVNATNVIGVTPLHLAAHDGHTHCCGALLAAGARLDIRGADRTPLEWAQHEHPANAELLSLLSGGGTADAPGTTCHHCGAREAETALRACSGCLSVRYCGAACSQAAWPGHKEECRRRQAEREENTRVRSLTEVG